MRAFNPRHVKCKHTKPLRSRHSTHSHLRLCTPQDTAKGNYPATIRSHEQQQTNHHSLMIRSVHSLPVTPHRELVSKKSSLKSPVSQFWQQTAPHWPPSERSWVRVLSFPPHHLVTASFAATTSVCGPEVTATNRRQASFSRPGALPPLTIITLRDL